MAMSTNEQKTFGKPLKNAKKRVSAGGMNLDKTAHMNNRVTWRELSIVAGVLVALLIALTFWFRDSITAVTVQGFPDFRQHLPSISSGLVSEFINFLF